MNSTMIAFDDFSLLFMRYSHIHYNVIKKRTMIISEMLILSGFQHLISLISTNNYLLLKILFYAKKKIQSMYFQILTIHRMCKYCTKEVQIVYRLFLANCYLLHVPRLPSQWGSTRTTASGQAC